MCMFAGWQERGVLTSGVSSCTAKGNPTHSPKPHHSLPHHSPCTLCVSWMGTKHANETMCLSQTISSCSIYDSILWAFHEFISANIWFHWKKIISFSLAFENNYLLFWWLTCGLIHSAGKKKNKLSLSLVDKQKFTSYLTPYIIQDKIM